MKCNNRVYPLNMQFNPENLCMSLLTNEKI